MLLRSILSPRNSIKDIYLKTGLRKENQEGLPADKMGPKWFKYLKTCVIYPSQWLPFPWTVTRLKSSAQQPSREMEVNVFSQVSELHFPNCRRSCSPPLPPRDHPEHISTGHDVVTDSTKSFQPGCAGVLMSSTGALVSSQPWIFLLGLKQHVAVALKITISHSTRPVQGQKVVVAIRNIYIL